MNNWESRFKKKMNRDSGTCGNIIKKISFILSAFQKSKRKIMHPKNIWRNNGWKFPNLGKIKNNLYSRENPEGYENSMSEEFYPSLMFTAILFTIAKILKQPKCPSMNKWIKKTHTHIHICTQWNICAYIQTYTQTQGNRIQPWERRKSSHLQEHV